MSYRHLLFVCATLISLNLAVFAQDGRKGRLTPTPFTCIGKPSGYYADVDTGCQVYHMCDGLGRQFSYKCPNMTLFQQRMLICDHWYMVNCSMSERDYDANLLIGQRDKPFVSDDEMRLRTPRPDILSVPPYNPYLDILRNEAKLPEFEHNDLDTKQSQNHIRSGNNHRRLDTIDNFGPDNLDQAASQQPGLTFKPTRSPRPENLDLPKVSLPIELLPPFRPVTEATTDEDSDEDTGTEAGPFFKFLKRFNPDSEDDHKTAMSKSEILDLNAHLPEGQVSSEDDRTPRKQKNFGNNLNTFKAENDKKFTESSRFDSVNTKSQPPSEPAKPTQKNAGIPEPERDLLPPKTEYEPVPSTTVGPPIYYEWRWAVPAFGLVPPKEDNETDSKVSPVQTKESVNKGINPFSKVTRPEPMTTTPQPSQVEYNISSYFVPDYIFPLDKAHPGYESDGAQTSFQVNVGRPGRASFGENPDCPQCHPAYLKPGTCEPCIVKR